MPQFTSGKPDGMIFQCGEVDIFLKDAGGELLGKELIFSVDEKTGNGFLYFAVEAIRDV